MTLQVYHQVGHNANWNIESFEDDGCGDGLILSPVHQSPAAIQKIEAETRGASLFDPQFYVPGSQKPKLQQYEFFPDNMSVGGFSTTTFEASVQKSAELCLKFQRAMGFRRLCIPTRFIDEMYSNYVDRQKAFSVEAFIKGTDADEEVSISLVVTRAMVCDEGFRTKILSWVTSYPNVRELCLTYSVERDTKQIRDPEFLVACHRLGVEMQSIGLDIAWSHQNTEALLFTVQGDVAVSMGSFENTRMFSTDKFLTTDEERRGPKARIYLRGLLNWVQIDQAKEIRKKMPKTWAQIYFETEYAEAALSQITEPTFNQPQLYKHYFVDFTDEIDDLKGLSAMDRRAYMQNRVAKAMAHYSTIRKSIALEKHGSDSHLAAWRDALKAF